MKKRKIFIRLDKHIGLRAYDKYNRQVNINWRYIAYDKFKVSLDRYNSKGYYIAGSYYETKLTIDELDEFLGQIKKEFNRVVVY